MFQYELTVKNLETDGHPFLEIHNFEGTACRRFEELTKKYPYMEITLNLIEKRVLKVSEPKTLPPPPQCPKGHKGESDGKSILKQGVGGVWNCGICGEQFRWDSQL